MAEKLDLVTMIKNGNIKTWCRLPGWRKTAGQQALDIGRRSAVGGRRSAVGGQRSKIQTQQQFNI
jgi:hypothetical protein